MSVFARLAAPFGTSAPGCSDGVAGAKGLAFVLRTSKYQRMVSPDIRQKSASTLLAERRERCARARLLRTGVPDPKSNLSRVTTGTRLFIDGGDGRTPIGRRYRDLLASYRIELGRQPTAIEDTLLRAAASMAIRQEQLAAAMASGESIDPRVVTQLSSELRRVLRELGIKGNGAVEPDTDRQRREAREAGL
jgi:hypothetical protein